MGIDIGLDSISYSYWEIVTTAWIVIVVTESFCFIDIDSVKNSTSGRSSSSPNDIMQNASRERYGSNLIWLQIDSPK